MPDNLKTALIYLNQLHYSVFPVGQDKKALVKWEQYQKKLPSEQNIREWWTKWPEAGIAVATGVLSNVCVIDLDELLPAKEVLDTLIPDGTLFPIVKTPSGGEHWYFACTDGNLRNNTRVVPGADLRANGGYAVLPNSYGDYEKNGKRIKGFWRWQGELKPTKIVLPFLPIAYKEYISTYINNNNNTEVTEKHKSQQVTKVTTSHKMFVEGNRDDDLFHVANCLYKGRMSDCEITQVIEKLALSCTPPFDLADVPIKIESAKKRFLGRDRNLTEDLKNWIEVTDGHFKVTNYHAESHIVTKEDKHAVIVALQRLVKEGIIEKWGAERGVYRKVDKESQTIDWYNTQVKALNIFWPFGIENLCLTMPKNLIVIAGSPNAGKSAFLLNVVKLNMKGKIPIHYFSSEMGAMEMKSRLQKFDIPLTEWRFNAKERASNFDDVIQPDDINIIDFLELSDQFYLVGGMLKAIFDKLKNGIAIIALQKNPGASMARGGTGTLEKPRLYISMDSGLIKIEKAKNWKDSEVNPNGLQCRFKLVQGAKFLPMDDWQYDPKKKEVF